MFRGVFSTILLLALALGAASMPCPHDLSLRHTSNNCFLNHTNTLVYSTEAKGDTCNWNIEYDNYGPFPTTFTIVVDLSAVVLQADDQLEVFALRPSDDASAMTLLYSLRASQAAGHHDLVTAPEGSHVRIYLLLADKAGTRSFTAVHTLAPRSIACDTSPCRNRGICHPKTCSNNYKSRQYTCECVGNFVGQLCDVPIGTCAATIGQKSYDLTPITYNALKSYPQFWNSDFGLSFSLCGSLSCYPETDNAAVCLSNSSESLAIAAPMSGLPANEVKEVTNGLQVDLAPASAHPTISVSMTFLCDPHVPEPVCDYQYCQIDSMQGSWTQDAGRTHIALSYTSVLGCPIGGDPCSPNPCQHSGACRAVGRANVECTCPTGYFGTRCEYANGDLCKLNPCANGGTCLELRRSLQTMCQCTDHFSGPTCSEDSFMCPADLVETQSIGSAAYIGSSTFFAYGELCRWTEKLAAGGQFFISVRSWTLMAGHSVVVTELGSGGRSWTFSSEDANMNTPLFLLAAAGRDVTVELHSPDQNSQDVEDMVMVNMVVVKDESELRCKDPSKCAHNATCTYDPTQYLDICTCNGGWEGETCQSPAGSPCGGEPCQHGGVCTKTQDGSRCRCVHGWEGDHCQVPPPCSSASGSCDACLALGAECAWCGDGRGVSACVKRMLNETCDEAGGQPAKSCPAPAKSSGLSSGAVAAAVLIPLLVVAGAGFAFYRFRMKRAAGGSGSGLSASLQSSAAGHL